MESSRRHVLEGEIRRLKEDPGFSADRPVPPFDQLEGADSRSVFTVNRGFLLVRETFIERELPEQIDSCDLPESLTDRSEHVELGPVAQEFQILLVGYFSDHAVEFRGGHSGEPVVGGVAEPGQLLPLPVESILVLRCENPQIAFIHLSGIVELGVHQHRLPLKLPVFAVIEPEKPAGDDQRDQERNSACRRIALDLPDQQRMGAAPVGETVEIAFPAGRGTQFSRQFRLKFPRVSKPLFRIVVACLGQNGAELSAHGQGNRLRNPRVFLRRLSGQRAVQHFPERIEVAGIFSGTVAFERFRRQKSEGSGD